MEKRIKNSIISAVRQINRNYCQERKAALKKAKIGPCLYVCSNCGCHIYSGSKSPEKLDYTPPEGIELKFEKQQLDHIEPVVSLQGWTSWDDFMNRLFCDESGYQVICVFCHRELKTKVENEYRHKITKRKKNNEDYEDLLEEYYDKIK